MNSDVPRTASLLRFASAWVVSIDHGINVTWSPSHKKLLLTYSMLPLSVLLLNSFPCWNCPTTLKREAAILVLGCRACKDDRLLNDNWCIATCLPCCPLVVQIPVFFRPSTRDSEARWAESWPSTTTRLHKFMPTPADSGRGVGLSRRVWSWLNRLLTGVEKTGTNKLQGCCRKWEGPRQRCEDCFGSTH